MDRKTKFLAYIISIKENDLSSKILAPLFSSMYKCRVEFSGGTQEKGKDLIIFNKDEFGFNETIGVQVKKTKPTANSTGGSIQQIITQLQQMRNEQIIDIDTAQPITINKLFFVTPYVIPENVLNHAQGAFRKIKDERAHIIDGDIIYKKLLQYTPSIIDNALGDNNSMWENILSKISNEAVTKSLNSKNKKQISDIYCEISFNLNHKRTNRYFEQEISKKSSYITIADNDKNQKDIDKNNEKIIKLTGNKFYEVDPVLGLRKITLDLEKELEKEKNNIDNLEKELINIFSLEDSAPFKLKTSNDINQIISEYKEDLKQIKKQQKIRVDKKTNTNRR